MEDHTSTTIKDARAYIDSQISIGKAAKCPCCTQTVKIYKRKIYSTMAIGLIELYKMNRVNPGYHHISAIESMRKSGGGDFAKMVYWGLIDEMPQDQAPEGQRTTGYWQITELGKAFVEERLTVNEYMHIFNRKVITTSGHKIGIQDALGDEFNYTELMAR